jgi:hypothetical protein
VPLLSLLLQKLPDDLAGVEIITRGARHIVQ